jgi:hypothetical protein
MLAGGSRPTLVEARRCDVAVEKDLGRNEPTRGLQPHAGGVTAIVAIGGACELTVLDDDLSPGVAAAADATGIAADDNFDRDTGITLPCESGR